MLISFLGRRQGASPMRSTRARGYQNRQSEHLGRGHDNFVGRYIVPDWDPRVFEQLSVVF